jgi:hypothetical protein
MAMAMAMAMAAVVVASVGELLRARRSVAAGGRGETRPGEEGHASEELGQKKKKKAMAMAMAMAEETKHSFWLFPEQVPVQVHSCGMKEAAMAMRRSRREEGRRKPSNS